MSAKRFLIAFEGERWSAACVNGERVECAEIAGGPGAEAGENVGRLAEQLRKWGWTGGRVCLGLPSDWVMAALIDCGDLPNKGRREAMRYRLEEELPMDAERLTADFMTATGGRTFALAVDTTRVREVLERLAEEGITPAKISATALLGLKDACRRAGRETDFVILAGTGQADVFRLAEGRPVAWNTVRHGAEELLRTCRAQMHAHPVEGRKANAAVVGKLEGPAAQGLSGAGIEVNTMGEGTALSAAGRGAAGMLADEGEGWADFMRDGLAPTSAWGDSPRLARGAATLAIALPLVLAGAFMWRTAQYNRCAEEFAGGEVAEYARLYPNTPVPASVHSRLKSEMTRQTGLSGTAARIPTQRNALEGLRLVATAVPDGVVKVNELSVDTTSVAISGEAGSHAEAELVGRGLRGAGFEVEGPRSEADQHGKVLFSMSAKFGTATATGPGAVGTGGAQK